MMPAKSAKQLRAMYAAAEGRSILGIPASVGREYVAETPKKKKKHLMEQHMTKSGRVIRDAGR
jgi:hypothetical protein